MSRGRGAMASPVSVPVAPGLMLDTGIDDPLAAYSLRRLRNGYTANKAIRVSRVSDSTTQDIGFNGSGELDVSALATFCSGTSGFITTWYNQAATGSAYDMIQTTGANMYRIYTAGAVEAQNGKPAARATDSSRGMVTAPFTAYTGTDLSAAMIGTISSGTSSFSPRYITLLPTGLNDIDNQAIQLIRRPGSSTPLEQWGISRANADVVHVGATYGLLQQVTAIASNGSYTLAVDGTGASGTTALTSFNVTRIGLGYSGSSYLSSADEYISEAIIWATALPTQQQTTVATGQSDFYNTADIGAGTSPNYLLDNAGVPTTLVAWSTRRLSASYVTNKCIQVKRDSDNTTLDIGFSSVTHALDTDANNTFCGSAMGYVSKWYNQGSGGATYDLSQTTLTNSWRIYDGANVETQNSQPSLHATDQARGLLTSAFSAYTGTTVSGCVVGTMSSASASFSPRYLSLIPTGLTDVNVAGAYLIARHGGTPDQTWGTLRNNTYVETATGVYNQLQLVTAIVSDPTYQLSVDGNNAVTATSAQGAFNFTQLGVGFGGGATYQTATDQYICEILFYEAALTSTQKTTIEANQRSWFNTAAPSGNPDPGTGGGGGGTPSADADVPTTGWVLVYEDLFSQGYAHNWNGVNVTSGPNPANWGAYGPGPGNEGVGTRTPANIVVQNGECALKMFSQQNTCAGMSGHLHPQKYGRWSIKFKQDLGKGAGPAILLWPASGSWPTAGEIDIIESPEGTCTRLHTTCHIGASNRQTGWTITTDLTQWHVITCIWTSSYIAFSLDGNEYYRNNDLSFQPPNAMWLAIQNDEGAAGHFIQPPTSSTPQPTTLHVDWVRQYRAA